MEPLGTPGQRRQRPVASGPRIHIHAARLLLNQEGEQATVQCMTSSHAPAADHGEQGFEPRRDHAHHLTVRQRIGGMQLQPGEGQVVETGSSWPELARQPQLDDRVAGESGIASAAMIVIAATQARR